MKRILGMVVGIVCLMFFVGCSSLEAQRQGTYPCEIVLESIPAEIGLLEEGIQSQMALNATIKNVRDNKEYRIQLEQSEDFQKTIYLKPGIYTVERCGQNMMTLCDFTVSAREERVEVRKGAVPKINLYIEDTEKLQTWVEESQPTAEILNKGQFSRQMQYQNSVFAIEEMLKKMAIEYEELVKPYEKITVTDKNHRGIKLELQNLKPTEEAVPYTECTVISISIGSGTVIFGGDVRVGKSIKDVCHATTGVYGKPQSMSGSPFIGADIEETEIIYVDANSGDKMTLNFDSRGILWGMKYELCQYE